MSEIIVGLITALAAVICQIIISLSGRSAAQRERAENNNIIVYRLEQLEKKMTLHNNVIERVYALEKDTDVIKEKINVANHRINDLERSAENGRTH